MGRWDDMDDREGYLAWFAERRDLQVFRDIGVDVDAWQVGSERLCTPCMWEGMSPSSPTPEPLDPKGITACERCGQPVNARGELLLARAKAFVEAVEEAGVGQGDTGSDDGPYDATGYAAIWVEDSAKEGELYRLAEEHGFGLDGTNEADFGEGSVLFYLFPEGTYPGLWAGQQLRESAGTLGETKRG